ncbi:MAG: UV DNA damage repair endonuclease UvsE [Elusimicrobiota bacterium]
MNYSVGCTSAGTYRLKNYTPEKFKVKVEENLACLKKILKFNLKHEIYFFRITSDLIPFASHEICDENWPKYFNDELKELGGIINDNNIRISMHPDQFIVLNTKREKVLKNSVGELEYHAALLDSLELDKSAKIQLHVGGVYGEKEKSMERFVKRYTGLSDRVKRRLVIENDDKSYTLRDCLKISGKTGVPVLFDTFHHFLNSSGESIKQALAEISKAWNKDDGIPMVDYSSSNTDKNSKGAHAGSLDPEDFKKFLDKTKGFDFDVMLEIKDKEESAIKAVEILKERRFYDEKK